MPVDNKNVEPATGSRPQTFEEIVGLSVGQERRNGIPPGFNLVARRATVLGDAALAAQVAAVLKRDFARSVQIVEVGSVDGEPESRSKHRNEALEKALKLADASVVYVALESPQAQSFRTLIRVLVSAAVSIYVVVRPSVAETLPQSAWAGLGEFKCLCILDEMRWRSRAMKRLLDLVVGSSMLLLTLPIMLLTALAVKFSSPGPVLWRQRRYGLDGREIRVWKFRTMHVSEDSGNVVQSLRHDVRITSVGAFLRRTALDELPQLFSVLGGQMSLVGPLRWPSLATTNTADCWLATWRGTR